MRQERAGQDRVGDWRGQGWALLGTAGQDREGRGRIQKREARMRREERGLNLTNATILDTSDGAHADMHNIAAPSLSSTPTQ